MSSQRPSFAKRDREARLRDKAKQKEERRSVRKDNPGGGGPPIDFSNVVTYTPSADTVLPPGRDKANE
ncbi:MAG TPA: hypothetical protein VGM39_02345 [Kofleriaceae bacterium]|jgi:hypothetical protein